MLGEIKHRSKKRGSSGREPKRGKKLNIALNQAEHGLKIGSPVFSTHAGPQDLELP